jgi:predicted membrane-bound spermidine synthase
VKIRREAEPRPRVEIRRGRDGLQLRVDGTLASFQRPGHALTGAVWWALAAPILLVPRRRRRVLLLGVGGGSVARALRALDPSAEIVGVEYDPEVLRLARRHFGLDALRLELVVDDALEYLGRERRGFDLIVEDLFIGPARTVRKPPWLVGEGYRLIRKRLRRQGIVVSNTIHETPAIIDAMRPLDAPIVSFDVHGHWNRIVACGRPLPAAREVARLFRETPALAKPSRKLSFRLVPARSPRR